MTFIVITSLFISVVYYSKRFLTCKGFFVKNIKLHNINIIKDKTQFLFQPDGLDFYCTALESAADTGLNLKGEPAMTNREILQTAMAQSAIDLNCEAADFLASENKVVLSRKREGARKYLELPFSCNLVSYGSNIVASVQPEYARLAEDYINRFPAEHCFETPNLHVLNDGLRERGQLVCFMAEYWLPDVDKARAQDCPYELRLLTQADFPALYRPEWGNALCEKRKELDVLGVGAYDRGKLVGFAGCSADCGTMWQIGVDVLPEYRRQGTASAVTARLTREILDRGKVPFYCCAWSNVKSARNAVRCGYHPAWVELTAKPVEYVDKMNGR